jgi:hypothetical protein
MIAAIYKRLLQIGKVSGAIAFLIAAPYAIFQYWEAQDAARVEQTLNFYKLYNAKPFTDYREKVTKALVKYRDRINTAAIDESSLLAVQNEMIENESIEMDIVLLFDFFDGVVVCVTSKVCDDDTAVRLFKPRATDIYLNFYQYMISRRATSATADFGVGLETVAKSGKPIRVAKAKPSHPGK